MRMVFASNNAHKLDEVRKILAPRTVCIAWCIGGFRQMGSHVR